mmetsp:Transcript_11537/g.25865  ORF Transcript_11537/g.25865 Transcript_11537/m.25865 type:complete len:279 (-) Transcript_11537:144-980(-)
MFNYHELTMNEPRGSPAKRKQFIVICCVVSFVCGNALINAGGFNTVRIGQGKFTGGEFVYKTMERDYAAFVGLSRTVGEDAGIPEADHENAVYSVFLDVDSSAGIPGGSERFMTGVLNGKDVKKELMAFNADVVEQPPDAYAGDYNEGDKFGAHIYYEVGSLPASVNAAVCQFVYTGGFMSPLIYEYKVFPAMIKYAKKLLPEDSPIVIASTCSTKDKMCTHYIPLQKADKFYLGKRPLTKDYASTINVSARTDFFAAVKATMRVLGFGGKKTNKEEL